MELNKRMRTHFLVGLALSLVLPSFSRAQVASYFEGRWSCEVANSSLKFHWDAQLVMDRQWLSGKTTKQGALLSTDFWRIKKNSKLSTRRVFLGDGSFVEMETSSSRKQRIKMTGHLQELSKISELRETIRIKSDDTFEAVTEKKVDKKWQVQSKETCHKVNTSETK